MQLSSRDLISAFKAAEWPDNRSLMQFMQSAGEVSNEDLEKLLDFLQSKNSYEQPLKHKLRCQVFSRLADYSGSNRLFVPCVKALKTPDPLLRTTLVPIISKINDTGEQNRLFELLNSNDQQLRKCVVQILLQSGGRNVSDILEQMVKNRSLKSYAEAMQILAETAGHLAIPTFSKVLCKGSLPDKLLALKYLGDTTLMEGHEEEAIKAIVNGFSDSAEQVVCASISAFCQVCSEDDYFEYIEPLLSNINAKIVCAAVEGLKYHRSRHALDTLDGMLRMGPNPVRMSVLAALQWIGDDSILPPLMNALCSSNSDIRAEAGKIFMNLGRAGKINPARSLIWLLQGKDASLRKHAAEIILNAPNPDTSLWPSVCGFLREEDWWVRESVIDELIGLAGRQMTKHYIQFLGDGSETIRRCAINALMRLNDPEAVGPLLRIAMSDSDWWCREKALEAVARSGDQRMVRYIQEVMAKSSELETVCINALRILKAWDASEHVLQRLSSPDPDVRLQALNFLDDGKLTGNLGLVEKLTKDPDKNVANTARDICVRWQGSGIGKGVDWMYSALDRLLLQTIKTESDDLLISSGMQAYVKRRNNVVPIISNVLTAEHVRSMLLPLLTQSQQEDLALKKDIDMSYELQGGACRFRVNIFNQLGGLSAVFRYIRNNMVQFEKLGLPAVIKKFGDLKNGLVLIGGPTGSGKSTTLAALIDYINQNQKKHIISLEDPIEVVHRSKTGLVNQREIGTHTDSFENAMRATLREDPDVILVGEMRDLPTISFAISAAETGHLVLGTIHTTSADTTIDRLINVFPPLMQDSVRSMLAESMRAVVCQYLLNRKDEAGRVLAAEIMINNDSISNLIRQGKCFQIPGIIATSQAVGMQSMDNVLMGLYKAGLVNPEEVYMKSRVKKDFEFLLELKKPVSQPPQQQAQPVN